MVSQFFNPFTASCVVVTAEPEAFVNQRLVVVTFVAVTEFKMEPLRAVKVPVTVEEAVTNPPKS